MSAEKETKHRPFQVWIPHNYSANVCSVGWLRKKRLLKGEKKAAGSWGECRCFLEKILRLQRTFPWKAPLDFQANDDLCSSALFITDADGILARQVQHGDRLEGPHLQQRFGNTLYNIASPRFQGEIGRGWWGRKPLASIFWRLVVCTLRSQQKSPLMAVSFSCAIVKGLQSGQWWRGYVNSLLKSGAACSNKWRKRGRQESRGDERGDMNMVGGDCY